MPGPPAPRDHRTPPDSRTPPGRRVRPARSGPVPHRRACGRPSGGGRPPRRGPAGAEPPHPRPPDPRPPGDRLAGGEGRTLDGPGPGRPRLHGRPRRRRAAHRVHRHPRHGPAARGRVRRIRRAARARPRLRARRDGASAVGAAAGPAPVADELGLHVTVFGTPAEEGGGRIHPLERGVFDGVHLAMMCHPGPVGVAEADPFAVAHCAVDHRGRAAHAAAHPEQGRNAADAFTVAQVAIGLLRRQLPSGVRVHGVMTSADEAPNAIPEHTRGRRYARTGTLGEPAELQQRVERCFAAGAHATGRALTIEQESPPYAEFRNEHALLAAYRRHAGALGRTFAEPGDPAARMNRASTDMGNVSQTVPPSTPVRASARCLPSTTRRSSPRTPPARRGTARCWTARPRRRSPPPTPRPTPPSGNGCSPAGTHPLAADVLAHRSPSAAGRGRGTAGRRPHGRHGTGRDTAAWRRPGAVVRWVWPAGRCRRLRLRRRTGSRSGTASRSCRRWWSAGRWWRPHRPACRPPSSGRPSRRPR